MEAKKRISQKRQTEPSKFDNHPLDRKNAIRQKKLLENYSGNKKQVQKSIEVFRKQSDSVFVNFVSTYFKRKMNLGEKKSFPKRRFLSEPDEETTINATYYMD